MPRLRLESDNQPDSAGERDALTEWHTILRLSLCLFALSLGLTLIGASLLRVQLPRIAEATLFDCLTGLIASVPLLGGLFFLRRSHAGWVRRLWDVPLDLLGPALGRGSQPGFLCIAAMAGVGEELVFRGLLQSWLLPASVLLALIVPNIVFGLLHYVNAVYAVAAGFTGLYFSILVQFVPEMSLFSVMFAHAFYDYIALNCLAAEARRR
ncbi:MAG: lysostaphin resistance A-like protein [Planctomycetota bacterium]|jgi:membrane protease YdiL (CAAX protease family)